MAKKLNAREKLQREKATKKVKLDNDFAGIKAGQMMFVATPMIVDAYIKKIPYGKTRSIPALRNELARQNKCDASCPISTSIFIRMAGEAALEEIADGKSLQEVTPFWRVLQGKDKITGKLDVDPDWVDQQREAEASL